VDRRAAARARDAIVDRRARAAPAERCVTAAALRAIEAEAAVDGRGGFYVVPDDAIEDAEAADHAFAGDEVVVDVQTHLVRTSRASSPGGRALSGFLRMVDSERWPDGLDPALASAASWASLVFGGSETAVALLTSLPGRPEDNVLTNTDIAAARDIVERYAGPGRVLTHTIVHPNLGPDELAAMPAWRDALNPSGWKVYTLWDPPDAEPAARGGWFLDDEATGIPFLEQVRATGPRIVCAHKGIAGPVPDSTPAGSSPRDIGPAAARFPDVTFVVYHSGYDVDATSEEGAHDADRQRGVSRLVTSLEGAEIEPGANVYAELGSTWFLMLRRPLEAAHVLGKLLLAVGPERVLWGTDSPWYGAPQFLLDAFRTFAIPEWMQEQFGYPALTREMKAGILSTNAARLYGVDLTAMARAPGDAAGWSAAASYELSERLA
jgi:predicted TIM-barrel fold metal-dependent hydrolase